MHEEQTKILEDLLAKIEHAQALNLETPRPSSLQPLIETISSETERRWHEVDAVQGEPNSKDPYLGSLGIIWAELPAKGSANLACGELKGRLLRIVQNLNIVLGKPAPKNEDQQIGIYLLNGQKIPG